MKVRKLFMLILSGVLLSLVLVGCGSSKKVFKESALENFTITRTFNDKTFEVKKNKNNYKVTDEDGNESFYALSGSKLFEHELTSKDLDVTSKTSADAEIAYRKVTLSSTSYTKGKYYIEYVEPEVEPGDDEETPAESENSEVQYVICDEDNYDSSKTYYKKVEVFYYVKSTESSSNISGLYNALLDLENANDLELKNNPFIAQYLDGIILDNGYVNAKDAYEREGLNLAVSSANLEVKDNKPSKLTITINYANETNTIVYTFSDFGSTNFEMLNEDTSDKEYAEYLKDSNPVVTFDFKGYGKVKVQLFVDYEDSNVTNYFLYCVKKNYYNKALVDAAPTLLSGILFGQTKETVKDSVSVDTTLALKNTRGILSMVVVSDSANTSQLVLNTSTNTTYDSSAYTPVGGVVEGFEILDALLGLTSEDFANVKVSVSVKYNGYKYSKPNFK